MRKGYRNCVTLQVWALNAVYVVYNCATLQGKPISFQLGNGWLENWVDYICGTLYSSDLWLASSIRRTIFGFSKCHMLIHSYRICLLFSHGEAVLIPADKHVIYIFCFQFWMKPFPAFVSAVHFCPSTIVKRHNHLIVILWIENKDIQWVVSRHDTSPKLYKCKTNLQKYQ